jgi:hypothetical protein
LGFFLKKKSYEIPSIQKGHRSATGNAMSREMFLSCEIPPLLINSFLVSATKGHVWGLFFLLKEKYATWCQDPH